MTFTKKKREFYSMIDVTFSVSESEIVKLYPEYQANWVVENLDDLKTILFDFGMDMNQNFEVYPVCQHRNRFGEIVTCARYVGQERFDIDYLKSGLASASAKDKARNSPLTDDLYRSRGLTTDMQDAMEKRDKYKDLEDEAEDW